MRGGGTLRIWLLLGGLTVTTAHGQENAALKAVADAYWQGHLRENPQWATTLGDYRYADRLDDLSEESRIAWGKELSKFQIQLNRLPVPQLSGADQLNLSVLRRILTDELVRTESAGHLNLLNALNGPHIEFPLIVESQPFRNADDYAAYIKRLRAFPEQVSQAINTLRVRQKGELTTPRHLVEQIVPQIRMHLVTDVTTSVLYAKPVEKAAALPEADRTRVTREIAAAIRTDVIPAYWRLLAFVQDEYLPACRTTIGLSDLPNGAEVYAALAEVQTTFPTKPDEIHEIGLREVARIRGEMARSQATLGVEGSMEQFLEHMRTAPEYRAKSAEELVQRYGAVLDRTKPLMTELVTRLPKADCIMKVLEPYRAASSPMAYYNPIPKDGSRPGYFYINTHAPTERTLFSLEALTYHEAVPGHHLQIALATELTGVPEYRQLTFFNAYIEGWALYAERLGEEIGGYQDPVQKFGQLNFEMWRACRLVVDTGMHAKGWPRERAIDYMLNNTAFTRLDVAAEIDRYIAWPAQALAYKMGELKIRDLRRRAEETLGAKFDVRTFNDALLADGAVPLPILEERMTAWLEAQKPR